MRFALVRPPFNGALLIDDGHSALVQIGAEALDLKYRAVETLLQ